ncbi:hypothetical protein GZH47_33345 (plasmid) [Paenibacillus rhizovicinus]|uniref:Uncharacterized protein n=1 Tax=Paenibacillus rhizovicinus TaxID=2704463 RepID=A0A6C0PBK7_9BACL|nr:hypothetical protein [Paenibacillus rhizovicinus]QHW35781.1 hypothetical protein GZH47_33345 [Paenibacillus rhizovicinus]
MELITAYLYNQSPIDVFNIMESTFKNMTSSRWFEEERQPKNFKIMNKRFKVADVVYRVVLRFRLDTPGVYTLDTPIPFAVMLSERYEVEKAHGTESRYKDVKVWHSKEMKSTIGYFQAGVPVVLINEVIDDLKTVIQHVDAPEVDIDLYSAQRRPIRMFLGGQEIGEVQSVSITPERDINGRPVRRVNVLGGGDISAALEADAIALIRREIGVGVAEAERLFHRLIGSADIGEEAILRSIRNYMDDTEDES